MILRRAQSLYVSVSKISSERSYYRSRLFPTICSSVPVKLLQPHVFSCKNYSSQGHIVQMRGLDYECREQDVIDFFKPLYITPKKILLRTDGSGRVTGVSEVEFATHAEAVVAMRKRNAYIGNRFIRLTLKSSEINDDQDENSAGSTAQKRSHTLSKDGLTIEGNIERSLFPTGHFVRMKNVSSRMTEQAIFQFFWPLSVLPLSVKQIYDENGRRKGEFDVEFLTHEDAVKAMSKNNAYLGKNFVELILNSASTPVARDALDEDKVNIINQNLDASAQNQEYNSDSR